MIPVEIGYVQPPVVKPVFSGGNVLGIAQMDHLNAFISTSR